MDEVQASLLYTTSHCQSKEGLFWCKELLCSGLASEAISTLFQSWLWNTGPMRLQWLINAWNSLAIDEVTENDILLATHQLSSIPHILHDNSLWNILILTATNNKMPDSITRKSPSNNPYDDEKEQYFIRALYQGKARCAWWISRYINNQRIWELLKWYSEYICMQDKYETCFIALKNYDKLLGYKNNEYDIITRCMAILIVCISPKLREKSFSPLVYTIDSENLKMLDIYDSLIGRKDNRLFSISKEGLYGITSRGKMLWTQNTLSQLNNIEKYLVGCPFWDEVISDFADINEKGCIIWHSDDKMEEFYNQYFPDDIPDEWVMKEKQKSHGDGILGPTEKPSLLKYSRIFMPRLSYLAWNTNNDVNVYLEGIECEGTPEHIVRNFKEADSLYEEDLKKLKPVHKIKIVG
jgi:hypothetical protein